MKVSIIMPVFNAATTLQKSLESIRNQSWKEIELCAVDDCSTDDSLSILEDFRKEFESIPQRELKVIRHNHNQGVAAARNTALDEVGGDLICWVDADDSLAENAISSAALLFEDQSIDIVGWDWTLSSPSGCRYMRQPDCSTIDEALMAIMGGTLRWNLWLFVVRRELFHNIRFIRGMNMGEDMMAVIRAFVNAGKFVQLHESAYSYLQREESVSRAMTDNNLTQVCSNLELAAGAIGDSDYSYLSDPYLNLLKLNVKLPLLVSLDKNDYIRWFNCYPEANKAIMLNKHLPMRTKVLQSLAAKRMWLAVRIYNKLVYGLLYKLLLCGR